MELLPTAPHPVISVPGFLWASQQSYKQVRSVLATEAQTELAPFFLRVWSSFPCPLPPTGLPVLV